MKKSSSSSSVGCFGIVVIIGIHEIINYFSTGLPGRRQIIVNWLTNAGCRGRAPRAPSRTPPPVRRPPGRREIIVNSLTNSACYNIISRPLGRPIFNIIINTKAGQAVINVIPPALFLHVSSFCSFFFPLCFLPISPFPPLMSLLMSLQWFPAGRGGQRKNLLLPQNCKRTLRKHSKNMFFQGTG